MNLTPEEKELLERANDYQVMVSLAGWKRLLDFLAVYSDARLSALRLNKSSDPHIKSGLSDRWVISEQIITDIQNEVLGAIEDKNNFVKQVLNQQGEEILQGGNNEHNEPNA